MPIKYKSGVTGKLRILRKKTYRLLTKKPKRISRKIRHFLTRHKQKQNLKRNKRITKIKGGGVLFGNLFTGKKPVPPAEGAPPATQTPPVSAEPKKSQFGILSYIGNKWNQTKNLAKQTKNLAKQTKNLAKQKFDQTRKKISNLKTNIANKTKKINLRGSLKKISTVTGKALTTLKKGETYKNAWAAVKKGENWSKALRGFKNKFVGLMAELINPVNVEGGGFSNSFFLQYLDIRSVKLVYNLNVDASISAAIIQKIKNQNQQNVIITANPMLSYSNIISSGGNNNDLLEINDIKLNENDPNPNTIQAPGAGPQEDISAAKGQEVGGPDGLPLETNTTNNSKKDIDVFIGGLTNSFYIYQKDENQKPIGNYISFGALNRATLIDQQTFEKLVATDKYEGATNFNTGYVCFAKEFEPFYRLLLLIKFNINRFLWTAKSVKVTADLTLASLKGILSTIVSSPKGISTITRNLVGPSEAAVQGPKPIETEDVKIDIPTDKSKEAETKPLDADPADLVTIFEEPFYYLLVQMKAMCLNSSNETFKKEMKSGAQVDAIKNSDTVTSANDVVVTAVKTTTGPVPGTGNIGGNNRSLSSDQNQNITLSSPIPSLNHRPVRIQNQKGGDIWTGRIKRVLKTFFEFEDKGWGITSSIRKVTGFYRYFPKFMEHEAKIALIQLFNLLDNIKSKLTVQETTISIYINKKKLLEKANFVTEFNQARCNEIIINDKIIDLNTLSDFESNDTLVAFLDKEDNSINDNSINNLANRLSQMAKDYFTKTNSSTGEPDTKGGSFFTRKNQQPIYQVARGKCRKPKNHRRTQKGGAFFFPYRFREIMQCGFNYAYQQMVGRIMTRLTKISETTTKPTGSDLVLATKEVPMPRQLINLYSKIRFAIIMGFNRSFFSVGNWLLPVGATPHLLVYMYLLGLSVYHDVAYANDPTFSKEFIALNGKIIFKTLLPYGKKIPISKDDPNPYKFIVGSSIIKFDGDKATGLNIQEGGIITINTIQDGGFTIQFSLQTPAETKTKTYVYSDYKDKPIFFEQNGVFVGSIYAIEQNGEECSIQFKKWKYDNKKTSLVPVEGDDKSIINKYFSLIEETSFMELGFNQVIPYVFQSPNYYLGDDYTLNQNHVHTHIPLTYKTIEEINNQQPTIVTDCTTIETNGIDKFSPGCEYAVNYTYLGKIQHVEKSNNILRGNDLVFTCDMINDFPVTKPAIGKLFGDIELYKVKPYITTTP